MELLPCSVWEMRCPAKGSKCQEGVCRPRGSQPQGIGVYVDDPQRKLRHRSPSGRALFQSC